MNSYERVSAALQRKLPDRVPLFECVIDEQVMQKLLPGCDYFTFNDWIEPGQRGFEPQFVATRQRGIRRRGKRFVPRRVGRDPCVRSREYSVPGRRPH